MIAGNLTAVLAPLAMLVVRGSDWSFPASGAAMSLVAGYPQHEVLVRRLTALAIEELQHFRAVYEPLAAAVVIVDTPDWGTADLTQLPYRHAPAGIFPLARDAQWRGAAQDSNILQQQAGQGDD